LTLVKQYKFTRLKRLVTYTGSAAVKTRHILLD